MSKVFAEQSVSLDGFSAGPNVAVGNGMGDGGERLHEWMFPADGSTSRSEEVRKETFGTSGVVVIGRRMFDVPLRDPAALSAHWSGPGQPQARGMWSSWVAPTSAHLESPT